MEVPVVEVVQQLCTTKNISYANTTSISIWNVFFFYKQWWFEECFLTNTRYTYFCIIYSSAVLTVIWLHLFNLKYQICQNMSPFWLTCSPSILIRSRDWSYSVKLIKLTHNCTWSESNNRSCQKSIYFNHNEKKLIKDANPHS